MQKPNSLNDYELEDEYDLSQMTALPKGRYDPERAIGENITAIAPDPSLLARQVSHIVTSDPRVLLVYMFGSHAQGNIGLMSDLDLGAVLTRNAPIAFLRAELTQAFSALSNEMPLDLVILNEAPIELAYSVISQGKVLYERSVAERVEYEAYVLSRYGDYLPFLRAQRQAILEGAGNDRRVQRYRETFRRTERTLSALGPISRPPPR
mgnify:CR=1 FL=1